MPEARTAFSEEKRFADVIFKAILTGADRDTVAGFSGSIALVFWEICPSKFE